jgi:predicted CoA-binding protein
MGVFQQEETIRKILDRYRIIAVVGLSDKPERDSYRVASYMRDQGYRIIPVNPRISNFFDEEAYPDLLSVKFDIEVVDIFRRGEEVPGIVDSAIEKGARAIWMQEGVINPESATRASSAGLDVVMDRCIMQEHRKYAF